MRPTPKNRLKEEFATGDHYAVISERLNSEGLGTKLSKPWGKRNLSSYFRALGMGRTGSLKSRPTKKPRAKSHDRLAAVVQILKVKSIDADERISLALLMLGE